MGGRVQRCPSGHHEQVRFNSCRHRACPRCAYRAMDLWLDSQTERLLDTDHFHVIFTVPSELRPLWAWNSRSLADTLFDVVRETLSELLDDLKFLCARPGVLAALHTWGRTLVLHPHIHCLVTGGGVTPEGRWKAVRNGFLLPSCVVRLVYRGKLLSRLEAMLRADQLRLPTGWNLGHAMGALRASSRKHWNVRIEKRYEHGVGVATYLARYMRGGPIKSSRVLASDGKTVSFRYGDHRRTDARGRAPDAVMTLDVAEFSRRWFRHVPEKGQRVVRAFGLYHHAYRDRLEACRAQCGEGRARRRRKRRPAPEQRCPRCGSLLVDGPMVPPSWIEVPIPTGIPPPPPEVSP